MKNLTISILVDKVAIKLYVFIFLMAQSLSASSQEINRVAEIWSNGSKKQVEYLNEDLEIVRVEYFDPSGNKVAEYNYDPKTGKKNGSFYDGTNKGIYDQDTLTAQDIILYLQISSENFKKVEIQSVENGVIKGEVRFYFLQRRELEKRIADVKCWDCQLKHFEIVRYSSYFGAPKNYFYSKLSYGQKGFIHGIQHINKNTTLIYDHGELEGVLTYVDGVGYNKFDDNGNFIKVIGIAKDSIFRDAKIWKRDFKFHKNFGLIDYFHNPHIYNLDQNYNVLRSPYAEMGIGDAGLRQWGFYYGQDEYNGELKLFYSENSNFKLKRFYSFFLVEEVISHLTDEGIILQIELPLNTSAYEHNLRYGINEYGYVGPVQKSRPLESKKLELIKWNIEFWIERYGIDVLTSPDFFSETFKYDQEKHDYLERTKGFFCSNYMFPCCHSAFGFVGKMGGREEHESILEIHEVLSSLTKFEFLLKMEEFTKKSSSDFYAKIHFVNRDNYVPSANSLVDFSNLINHTQEKYKIFQDNRGKRISEIHNEFKITEKYLEKALDSEDWSSARIYYKKMLDIQKINHNEGLRIVFDIPTYAFVASFDDIPNYINLKEKDQKILAEYNKFLMNVSEVSSKNNILLDTTKLRFSKEDFLSNKIGFSEQTFESFTVNLLKVIEYIPKLINTYFKIDGRYHLSVNFNAQKRRLEFQFQVKIIKVENDFLFTKKDLKNAMKSDSTLRLLLFSDKLEEAVFYFGDLKRTFRIDANN